MNSRSHGKVTRADVARMAGTSTAVVSYVLNAGTRPVAPATRQRVLDAIAATGYRPNHVAQALASGTTRTLGLIVPDISNPFFSTLAHALEEESSRYGLVLLLGDSAENVSREEELVRNFLARQIDALVYVGVDDHSPLAPALESGMPVVVLDRVEDAEPASSVAIDNRAGAQAATEHLIEHGARTIGFIGGPLRLATSQQRMDGWRAALDGHGLDHDDSLIYTAAFTKYGGYVAARELLTSCRKPRSLFVASEEQALGVLRAAAEHGINVPEDLAVITFDGTEASEYASPPLTSIAQPFDEIARHSIELLRHPEQAPSTVVCSFALVLRRSCGCPG